MTAKATIALSDLKGVGPSTLEKLEKLGLRSIYDLLFHMPLRFEDKTRLTPMTELNPFRTVQVQGEVVKAYIIQGRKPILVCEISDGLGLVSLKFFNFFYSQRIKMKAGSLIRAYGEVRPGKRGFDMMHPEYQHLSDASEPLAEYLEPVYPKSDGLSQKLLRKLIAQVLDLLAAGSMDVTDHVPLEHLQAQGMPDLSEAIHTIHQPRSETSTEQMLQWCHPAQHRMMLEEILVHLLNLKKLKADIQSSGAVELQVSAEQQQAFESQLSFTLTGAQSRVIAEIYHDVGIDRPMQRLLQGDVGSGKTVVAAAAIKAAVDNGYQAALMAPTEILAEQHMKTLKSYFQDNKLVFLSGSLNAADRRLALEEIASDADVIIGTHALFQEQVNYRNLALVVIDEQHRFGVQQRLALKQKGEANALIPHTLIMTATPIPRTLAQTVYANLDVSVIDELPPNRKEINTVLLSNEKMSQLAERVIQACAQGEQAYWVCTLIDESEKLNAIAATERMQELKEWFPDLNIGLVHGRMKSDEKQEVMQAFMDNRMQLLVATTVIEVGVDVPNASLMVIDNAERLGLSQLHQLRGRVGRGNRQSHCVLMYQHPLSETAKIRLQTMRETNDGFAIARQDLKLRGPGEILGSRQTGAMAFRLINIERDHQLIAQARQLAEQLLKTHPEACDQMVDRWNQQQQDLAKI